MKYTYFLVLALILFTSYCAKFNIASTSTCTSTSAAGFCTKWEQNGTVEEQTVACFTGDMLVMTKQGFKSMSDLQIGDEILSYDREKGEVYTKIRGWLHKDSSSDVEFMKITFENGQTLKVSQKHNIAFANKDSEFSFRFAIDVDMQEQLYGSSNKVKSIEFVKERGMYAPLTYINNYFVFTSATETSSKILAHDFANIKSPESYEPITNIIFSVYQSFSDQTDDFTIHPAAKWMMDKFGFLMQ